jgi:uncharacterized membrane protein
MDIIKNLRFKQVFPWILVIGGIIGLLASSILTIEKMHVLANPSYQPSCSISPVVACSPVMTSWQANTFKFPNMFVGLAGFGMVWAVGMMLLAGAKNLKKWFWWCFQAGTLFGTLFITWLQYSSIYNIQKLCIYCMVVWVVTIPIFWATLSYNLREKNIKMSGVLGKFLLENPGKLIALHYLIIIVLIFSHFAEYSTL